MATAVSLLNSTLQFTFTVDVHARQAIFCNFVSLFFAVTGRE